MSSLNVDPGEIANFQKQAATWWDPKGPMRALHHINPPRVAYIEKCAGGLKGKHALDVGCGGGLLTEALAARGAEVTGIDLADEALEVARLHGLESGVKAAYRSISAEALAAEAPASYDLVCCLEMLEHVPDPASVLRAIATLVRPGGTVVLSTINRNPKAFALAVLGAEYLLNLVPRGTHDYSKFIRPSELTAWARAAGLEPLEIKGLSYNPLSQQGRIGSDIDVNYFLHCRKPE
ncbi:MAG: bifunctional 2-polyprenyl-6-hydroxyphenol methylase/3-demethylubiquinol 3-O-methyltransferase UbiG [Stagnimonas sp.]|nr:bifunctional 2-polyprenyl-6-hydroxyphenol methylase/3-demethylubiquinol 3-O-methyltransferase UbiG [Stagnimonas sp.]